MDPVGIPSGVPADEPVNPVNPMSPMSPAGAVERRVR